MIKIFVTAAIVGASVCGTVAAQVLTLDEYLSRVHATHPFFAREAMETDVQKKERESLIGAEDWELVGSPSFTHREPVQQSPFDPERVDFLELGAGVNRVFWNNGSRLSLSWVSDLTDQKIPGFAIPGPGGSIEVPIGPSRFYRHALRAAYSLPLLQNRGGSLDRLAYELKEFDVDLSEVLALENQENFLLEQGLKFLDWALSEEQLRIAGDRLALAREELERSKRKRAANLIDEVDVRRAEDAVFLAQSAVNLVESRWKAAQAELATLASSDDVYQMTPLFDLYERVEIGETDAVVEETKRGSRLVQTLEIRRSQLRRIESGFAETTRPQLALNLMGSLQGGNDEFGPSLEMTHPDVTVGVEFRYPLGNRGAAADVAKTRLQTVQLTKAIEDTEISLEAGLRRVLVQIGELEDVLANNVAQIETARRRTDEEIKLYNQGRGDLTFVIQSRDSEASSKLSYAENSALYHSLVLQYRALTDEFLAAVAAR